MNFAPTPKKKFLYCLVFFSGLAALSWETLWQIKATLALGVSAWGTAITISVTMGGMCLGALGMGRALRDKNPKSPLRIYAALEALIGIFGLLLPCLFSGIEQLDNWAYGAFPGNGVTIYLFGITMALILPAICMGATLPVLGLVARQYKISLAGLYGLNTLGAAFGVLGAAFILIPAFGVQHTIWAIAAFNFMVAALAWLTKPQITRAQKTEHETSSLSLSGPTPCMIAAITGFVTFVLEVSWFRSLTATFHSTTDAFAIMLATVLIALGLGARLVPLLKRKNTSLGMLLALAGILILLATPIIERFDLITENNSAIPFVMILNWFSKTLFIVGLPILFLGTALPWLLDDQQKPRGWATLYAINAFAAIIGALSAAWIFLPAVGVAKTAWLAGTLVVITAIFITPPAKKIPVMLAGLIAFSIAVLGDSGIGIHRAQGWAFAGSGKPTKLVHSIEGPQATISVVAYEGGYRALIIDGFAATSESPPGMAVTTENYMAWMGHLPMLLHPKPQNALVICFGTGQTANAVRRENPKSLDIVDVNPQVFKLASHFHSNQNVLEDSRVTPIVMDGRAWLRRTDKIYDVITLEPMPPNFAGVNALYSREFYEIAKARLGNDGVIAQWLPIHIVPADYSVAITKTFQSVFPNSFLWLDPLSNTGILIGLKNENTNPAQAWKGFRRQPLKRTLSEHDVKKSVVLNRKQLENYAASGGIVTDNNQILAYGKAVYLTHMFGHRDHESENITLIQKAQTP